MRICVNSKCVQQIACFNPPPPVWPAFIYHPFLFYLLLLMMIKLHSWLFAIVIIWKSTRVSHSVFFMLTFVWIINFFAFRVRQKCEAEHAVMVSEGTEISCRGTAWLVLAIQFLQWGKRQWMSANHLYRSKCDIPPSKTTSWLVQ